MTIEKAAAIVGVGGLGLWLVWRRRRSQGAGDAGAPARLGLGAVTETLVELAELGEPVEARPPHKLTPHGYYGAPRPGHTHQGADVQAPKGSAVLAVGDGVIVPAQPGVGKEVLKLALDRPGRWGVAGSGPLVTHVVYADLGPKLVNVGDRVKRGQPIARVWGEGFVHFATKKGVGRAEEFFDSALAGFQYQLTTPAARGPAIAQKTPATSPATRRSARAAAARRNGLTSYRSPLGADGRWAPWVRALEGAHGVYVIRDASSRAPLYVGESHTGRLMLTMERHLWNWDGRGSGPSYSPERVEVAVEVFDDPGEAIIAQYGYIRRLEPRDNVQDGHSLRFDDLSDVPF